MPSGLWFVRRHCAAPFAVVAIDCHAASVCRIVDVVASNSFMLITNTHDTYLRADAVAQFGERSAAASAAGNASERGDGSAGARPEEKDRSSPVSSSQPMCSRQRVFILSCERTAN